MVSVDITVGEEDKQIYMDKELHNQLINTVQKAVQKKDFDYVLVIDGEEGSGKSVLAFQIAKVLDPKFSLDNVCFTPNGFIKAVINAKPNSCIVFDEAFTGLSSRSALSEINQLMVALMMEMRQKNLFIILVMPTFFMLDKYAVLHRAKCMIHVYLRNDKRGFWGLYNKWKMKTLYFKGKKFFDYSSTKPIIFGRFLNQYTLDELAYREKKKQSLNRKRRLTRAEAYKEQRDALFYIMYKDYAISQRDMVRKCKKRGFRIAQNTISEIIALRERNLLTDI